MNTLQQVILTLQYCLETFEQACHCGRCDPCTKGQRHLQTAIGTMNALSSGTTTSFLYVLERPSARAEFTARSALIKFVRELAGVAPSLAPAEPSLDEVAAMAARNSWQLFELPTFRDARSAPDPAAKKPPDHRCLETLISAHQLMPYPSENVHFNSVFEKAKSALERHPRMDELYVVQYSCLDGAPAFACALPTQISDRGPFYLTDICAVVRQ